MYSNSKIIKIFLEEGYWIRPQLGGFIPQPRYLFSMDCNQSDLQSEIILIGGRSTEQTDKFIYILSEMTDGDKEAWGESENAQRLEFEGYRELMKNKKKQDEIKNVSMMTLEFSQAEKIIVEQKTKISELESLLKQLQIDNFQTEQRHNDYDQKIKMLQIELEEKNNGLIQQIQEKKIQNQERQQFLDKIKILVCLERKKRKIMQIKQYALQDSLRKAEAYVITLDSLISKAQREDLLNGVISEEAQKKIERLKVEHKQALILFKDQFDMLLQKEKKIKQEIKDKKTILKPDHLISKEWKQYITKEEKVIFENKIKQ